MKTKIFQIYTDEITKAKVEDSAIGYDNSQKFDCKLYENRVILDLYEAGEFSDCEYCGVLSTRVFEKTGKHLEEFLFEIIDSGKSADAYILCAYNSRMANNFWNATFAASRQLKYLLNFKYPDVLPFTISANDWVNCYCNFVLIRPEYMRKYVETVLKPVLEFFENTKDQEVKALVNSTINHRGKDVSIIPFFVEGLMGSFISDACLKYKTLATPNDYQSK